jgi:hypothetical protein
MKSFSLNVAAIFLLFGYNTVQRNRTINPELVSAGHTEQNNSKSGIIISSGQISHYYEIKINNCLFKLVTGKNSDTIYLETEDTTVFTVEGYKVGMKFSQISSALKKTLIEVPG